MMVPPLNFKKNAMLLLWDKTSWPPSISLPTATLEGALGTAPHARRWTVGAGEPDRRQRRARGGSEVVYRLFGGNGEMTPPRQPGDPVVPNGWHRLMPLPTVPIFSGSSPLPSLPLGGGGGSVTPAGSLEPKAVGQHGETPVVLSVQQGLGLPRPRHQPDIAQSVQHSTPATDTNVGVQNCRQPSKRNTFGLDLGRRDGRASGGGPAHSPAARPTSATAPTRQAAVGALWGEARWLQVDACRAPSAGPGWEAFEAPPPGGGGDCVL